MTDQSQSLIVSDGALLGTVRISAARVGSNDPVAYRLGRRNGELVLQGAFKWTQGLHEYGMEWRDIPIVELDDDQPTSENV